MLELRVLSPIAKVFPQDVPEACAPRFSGLLDEIVSFQIAYRLPEGTPARPQLRLEIASEVPLRARRVKYVPVRMPALPDADDNYLAGKQPGLYPDPLTDIPAHGLRALAGNLERRLVRFRTRGCVSRRRIPRAAAPDRTRRAAKPQARQRSRWN